MSNDIKEQRPIAELVKEINERLEEIIHAGDMVINLENKTGHNLGLFVNIKGGNASLVLVPPHPELSTREEEQRFYPFPDVEDEMATRIQLTVHFSK